MILFFSYRYAQNTPINTSLPTVTTTGKIGSGVVGNAGSWTGASSFTYQHQYYNANDDAWYNIEGETSLNLATIDPEYNLTQGRLAVTAVGTGGSTTAYSASYDITYVAPVITNSGVISGTGKIGSIHTHTNLEVTGTVTATTRRMARRWRRHPRRG